MASVGAGTGTFIRVVVVDDQAIVRDGVARILGAAPDIDVVGTYASGEAALRGLDDLACDVCVLDLTLPGIGGLEVAHELRQSFPQTSVLVLTMHPEGLYGVRCLAEGASGYLTKGHGPDELLDAVRTLAAGRRYMTPEMAQILADRVIDGVPSLPHESLSQREYEVFTMLARGDSITEIGLVLHISVKTVSTYRSRVLQKFGFSRNAQLTTYALENGFIDGSHR